MSKVVIPYKYCGQSVELKYTLRGIEKYVDNPEVLIIGDMPRTLKGFEYIPHKCVIGYKWKERNIYEKLMLVNDDFIYFNDDHYLLEPFNYEYHYSGTLEDQIKEYEKTNNQFRQTLINTIGALRFINNIENYYRHQPFFIKNKIFKDIKLDWGKEWGYCIKSVYGYLAEYDGKYCRDKDFTIKEYPDLKIREPLRENKIRELIKGRQYFSTDDGAINRDMVKVLESIYPFKSKYE